MCDYNRKITYAICHGLIKSRGAGFVPIHASSVSDILYLLKNWWTPTEDIRKTFQIVVAWSQYQAGTSYSIFQRTDTNLDFIDGQICHAIRKYLIEIQDHIKLTLTYVQRSLCTNNIAIIDDEASLLHLIMFNKNK